MDIARLLNDDSSDGRGDESASGETRDGLVPAPVGARSEEGCSSRTKLTRRPTRRPRKPTIESMRAQVLAFEYVVANLQFVLDEEHDDLDNGNECVCDEAQRMRSFLRRAVINARKIHEERAVREALLAILRPYYESVARLDKLMSGLALDDWHWTCERWRALSLDYYVPLPEAQCYEIVQETLQAIKSHKLPKGSPQKGSNFFGWRDLQTLDRDKRFVHFITRKTMWRSDIERCANHTWAIYGNGDDYKSYHLEENSDFFHQVLQRVSHDIIVIQTAEKYPGLPKTTYSLSIVFRAQTETGYVVAVRCVESPALRAFMKSEGLSLSGNFYWNAYDVDQRDAQGDCTTIKVTLAGCIGSDDCAYAQYWNTEIAIALVRAEMQVMGTPIVSLEC